ncbi:MAG: hypothetical protein WC329_05110 [Candidatus Omnitrophota bacterium]|jgi:hypothetical protein
MSTWVTKVNGAGKIIDAAHINKLQDEKADLDKVDLVIRPEQYGAVGDGVTDDFQAFVDMFDDIKTGGAYAGYIRRRIVLNPTAYYCIKSRTDADKVFEIAVNGIIIEGPGMGIKAIAYEGALAATHFIKFTAATKYASLEELNIVCAPGDDSNTRALSKITNIIYFDDSEATQYASLSRCMWTGCTGYGLGGWNWMTEIRHCYAKWCGHGFGSISTTSFVANCYANACTIGYDIQGSYGVYLGCASDWATIAYKFDDCNTVSMVGCGCEAANQGIVGYAYSLSISGFFGASIDSPTEDAFISLNGCGGSLMGLFDSGYIKNTYFLETTNCPNLIIGPWAADGEVDKSRWHSTDSTDSLYLKPRFLGNDYWDMNSSACYCLPADFEDLILYRLRDYDGVLDAAAFIKAGTVTLTSTLRLINMKGWGKFMFKLEDTDVTATITFGHSSGNAFELLNINIPLEFNGRNSPGSKIFEFHQAGTGVLFKLTNCQFVRFYGVVLDADASSGDVFEIDDFSFVEIDKTVMDLMDSANFSGLCNKPERLRFTGYSDKPASGLFDSGCKIYFDAPTAGGYLGCVCTVGGAPGTWKYFGLVEA